MASILTADDLVNIKHTVLTLERQEIARNVDPSRFFGHLRAKYVFDERDCDEIRAQSSRVGSAEVFVDTLKRKGGRGYDEFCNALMNDKTQLFLLQRLTQTLELLRARVVERKTEKGIQMEHQQQPQVHQQQPQVHQQQPQVHQPLHHQFSAPNQTVLNHNQTLQYRNQQKPSHSILPSNLPSSLPSAMQHPTGTLPLTMQHPSTLPSAMQHSSTLPLTMQHSSTLPSAMQHSSTLPLTMQHPSTLPSAMHPPGTISTVTLPSNFHMHSGNMHPQYNSTSQSTNNTPSYLTQNNYPSTLHTGRQFQGQYQQQQQQQPNLHKPLRKIQSRQTEKEYNQQVVDYFKHPGNPPNPNNIITNAPPGLPPDSFAPIINSPPQQQPHAVGQQPSCPTNRPYKGGNDFPQDHFWKQGAGNPTMFPRGMNHGFYGDPGQPGEYEITDGSDQPCGQIILARGSN